jgi:hypothetical protein
MTHGAFWFMDVSKFNNRNIFQTCLDNIQVELSRSKEEFLQEHFAKYTYPNTITRQMGFPHGWENEPLWQ